MEYYRAVFNEFLRARKLKCTGQRDSILDVFLKTERHLTADEIYGLAKKRNPKIGYATVYRTLNLLYEVGLAREVNWGDGKIRYEHKYRHRHHDHLICTKCGKSIEVFDKQLEKIQAKLSREKEFIPTHHQLNIYGVCDKCRKR
ncbi:MAG: transcriptional repressor [Candidatus Stahlbacteria bacterium]|nr:transcriptional repressor [Candidatus Stahlbacteria bacterium]